MSTSTVRLSDVATLNPPTPRGLLASDAEVAVVPMAAVSEQGSMQVQEYKPANAISSGLSYFADGDVLVAKITPCYENNKITQAVVDREHAFGSTEFHVLRPARERLDGRYLTYFLRQDHVREAGVRRMTGSGGQRRVPRNFLAELEIPLPPLHEQRRIAAILDQADALRRKRREALAGLRGLYGGLFAEMFGDWSRPGRLVPMIKIGDQLDFLTSGSRGWAEHYSDSGSLFLRIQNVRYDQLDLSDTTFVAAPDTAEARRTRVQPGDVLLSITADLGRTAVVPEGLGEAFINQHLAILRSKSFIPRYLSAALASPAGQQAILRRNREGVKAGLNFDDIRSLEVPHVGIDLQTSFARRAAEIDELKRTVEDHQAHLDALFTSLQHRAFRGEL